ncbi:MAG: AAA family ATPase [Kofleriaceae bacterium]|nr:AAA family ATPase [Kofleriaceae bacterium]MCB9571221.1 AAA family ATPase [Kofleriaceae bacterium]
MRGAGPDDGLAWGELLARRRAAAFVGRERELATFRALLAGAAPHVLAIHGAGGTGKSTLLARLADLAADAGAPAVVLDGRDLDPWPDAILGAILQACGAADAPATLDAVAAALAARPRPVLLVDTFEAIATLEPWLRDRLLPRLPAGALAVVAGRHAPSSAWRADPGWHGLLTTVELGNLGPTESAALLARRGVPAPAHAGLHALTHGHPLALALVADVAGRDAADLPTLPPDMVRVLLERFVRDVPSAAHRDALGVLALARVTTESLLRATMPDDDAAAAFAWLRTLSFVGVGRDGLYPHDLARDVLDRDLTFRDPDGRVALRRRLAGALRDALRGAPAAAAWRMTHDLLFLRRGGRSLAGYFAWRQADAGHGDVATAADHAAIAALIEAHEGAEAAAIAHHWLGRRPDDWLVFRGDDGAPRAAVGLLDLRRGDVGDVDLAADPAIAGAWRHVDARVDRAAPVRMLYARFWVVDGAYQQVSPTQDLIQTWIVSRWVTTPGLSFSFVATRHPERWSAQFDALDMPALPALAFVVGGASHVVHGFDWRDVTTADWLAAREPDGAPAAPSAPRPALDDLDAAVRAALRDFARGSALATNPLGDTAVVARVAAGRDRAEAIRAALRAVAAELGEHPRDARLLRALEVTYFRAAPSQEAAAERAGVPFGTFRRHLARAVERLVELVVERERAARAEAR